MENLNLGTYGIIIEEIDGTPSGFCTKLKVTNGGLTDNGDGSFILNLAAGAVDHGSLTGLSDDDHTQYGLLVGRAGGQVLIGGTGSGDDLTLRSTSHATKGTIIVDSDIGLSKTGVADVGTQYPSYDLELTCSVWDTTNTQAEDRTWKIRAIGGSGVHGSEVNYISFLDNGDNEIVRIDPLRNEIRCEGVVHLAGSDINTGVLFNDDAVLVYAGAKLMVYCLESGQDELRLASDPSDDIDVSIGKSASLFIHGADGRIKLKETGSQDLFAYEGSVVDDGSVDLPNPMAGFVMVTFDEGADYALCNITDAGGVTLVANSANVVNTDTDGNYCIFDNGTKATVKNRIGSSKNIKIFAIMG